MMLDFSMMGSQSKRSTSAWSRARTCASYSIGRREPSWYPNFSCSVPILQRKRGEGGGWGGGRQRGRSTQSRGEKVGKREKEASSEKAPREKISRGPVAIRGPPGAGGARTSTPPWAYTRTRCTPRGRLSSACSRSRSSPRPRPRRRRARRARRAPTGRPPRGTAPSRRAGGEVSTRPGARARAPRARTASPTRRGARCAEGRGGGGGDARCAEGRGSGGDARSLSEDGARRGVVGEDVRRTRE
jgi:hypothetical protein